MKVAYTNGMHRALSAALCVAAISALAGCAPCGGGLRLYVVGGGVGGAGPAEQHSPTSPRLGIGVSPPCGTEEVVDDE